MKVAKSIYTLFVGFSMIGMWSNFLITGQIPELDTKPMEIVMHIIIEFGTAVLLIISGLGILKNKHWSNKLFLFSSGMLFYSIVNSSGYYLERKEWVFILMFTILLIPIIIFNRDFFKGGNHAKNTN